MRRPFRLLAFLLAATFPAAVIVAADIPVVPFAEARLEEAAAERVEAESVSVDVAGFPVIARALAKGEVGRVDYRWEEVRLGQMSAASLDIRLEGVGISRSRLLAGDVRIQGVQSGDLEAQISLGEIGRLLDRDVRVVDDQIVVSITPVTEVVGLVSASADGMVLTAGPLEPVVVDFDPGVIPCAPRVELENSVVMLRCSFRGLPPLLRS